MTGPTRTPPCSIRTWLGFALAFIYLSICFSFCWTCQGLVRPGCVLYDSDLWCLLLVRSLECWCYAIQIYYHLWIGDECCYCCLIRCYDLGSWIFGVYHVLMVFILFMSYFVVLIRNRWKEKKEMCLWCWLVNFLTDVIDSDSSIVQ